MNLLPLSCKEVVKLLFFLKIHYSTTINNNNNNKLRVCTSQMVLSKDLKVL